MNKCVLLEGLPFTRKIKEIQEKPCGDRVATVWRPSGDRVATEGAQLGRLVQPDCQREGPPHRARTAFLCFNSQVAYNARPNISGHWNVSLDRRWGIFDADCLEQGSCSQSAVSGWLLIPTSKRAVKKPA